MGIGRGFFRVYITFVLISMVLLSSLARSSRTRFLLGAKIAEETESIKKELETRSLKGFGNGGSVVEVEGRQVPQGPDPLHHNDSPTAP